jgi:hypothetical protein
MRLLPYPSGLDDFRKRGTGGLPPEFSLDLFAAGDKDGGIPGPAGENLFGDFTAGYKANRVQHFTYGVSGTRADIEGSAGDAAEVFERAKMGISDVQNVNVIADAGAIWRWVVRAKDSDVRVASLDSLQGERDEMGFVAAAFTAIAGSASNIEITEGDVIQASVPAVVGEDIFKDEFRFAVGIYGRCTMVLGQGDGRFAIYCTSGGKDEIADAMAEHGVEKDDAARDVRDIKSAGILHGLLDESFSSEMHHGVDVMALEDFIQTHRVTEIDLVK